MDNAKQFAYFPVAVLKGVDDFSNGTISVKFKTVAGDARPRVGHPVQRQAQRRLAGRPLQRHRDTTSRSGSSTTACRRIVKRQRRGAKFMLDRAAWHELKLDRATAPTSRPGSTTSSALDYTLGSEPGPGRNGAPPNPDLFPANNPVLRPPVSRPASACGPRPTAPAISRTTSSRRSE